jgi:two-component system, NtrC family, response regulator HydG
VDLRLVAATNQDLRAAVREGRFREDLYYRLNVIAVPIPPLRDRRDDIPLLAEHFLQRYAARNNRQLSGFSRAAAEALARHDWPGNVRELLHAIEAAMVVCEGDEILPEHLSPGIRGNGRAPTPGNGGVPTLRALERAHIERVLRETQGHRSHAAKLLGISERNLYRKIRAHRLES